MSEGSPSVNHIPPIVIYEPTLKVARYSTGSVLTNATPQHVAIVDGDGTQITSFGGGTQYTEDAAAAANPIGGAQILIRADTPAGITTTDGDNVARRGTDYGAAFSQIVDSSGNLVDSFGGGTAYTEDVATANPIVGIATMIERDDQLAAVTPVEGDWISLRGTAKGALWVALADASGDPITSFGGGTQYTEGDTDATITGTAMLMEGAGDALVVAQGTAAAGLLVNLGTNNDVAVTGTVTANAGTNLNTSALATSAKQLADGHNVTVDNIVSNEVYVRGSQSAGAAVDGEVMTIQGIASMTPVATTESSPISGFATSALQLADGHNVTIDNIISNEVYVRGSGTAGTADAAVLTIQGIASMTPLSVTESSPISGFATSALQLADGHNVTVDNISTNEIFVRGGGTAGSATDGEVVAVQGIASGTAMAVTESSPISGFATSAGQLADGHNVTIDNGAAGSAVNIQDGGNTITVDGTVGITANSPVNVAQINGVTALMGNGVTGTGSQRVTIASNNTAFSVNSTLTAETTKVIGTVRVASGGIASGSIASGAIASGAVASGAVASGAVVDGAIVTLGAKTDAKSTATDATSITAMQVLKQISASVQAPPSQAVTNAGTFAVQPGSALTGSGNPTIDSYTHLAINLNAAANQVLVASAASKQIWVYGITYTCSVAGTVSFQDEDDTAITGIMDHAANSGLSHPTSGNFAMPIWKCATNKDLEVDVVTAAIDGWLDYSIVSV